MRLLDKSLVALNGASKLDLSQLGKHHTRAYFFWNQLFPHTQMDSTSYGNNLFSFFSGGEEWG
jgi:hypothetical protein